MKKKGSLFQLLAALLSLGLLQMRTSLGAAQDSTIVLKWNAKFLNAIQNETTSPPLAARNLAVLHVAMFDAVNAIEKQFKPFHSSLTATNPANAAAAANAAGHVVCIGLFPSQRAEFEKLYNELNPIKDDVAAIREGLHIGETVAAEILEWRVADGVSTSVTYIPRNEPGAWRRTPPYFRPPEMPAWRSVRPFAIKNCKEFRPAGPPALSSPAYAQDVNQVKELGGINSTKRTTEQTQIAKFWSDFSYTETPPGHWNSIARDMLMEHPRTLLESARLFALLNVAMADTSIVVWDTKYEFNWWRPVTAIREADRDGNDSTVPDKEWISLLPTPPFPEYVSGHAAFSGAAAEILKAFFGRDQMEFTVVSDGLPGVTRHFNSFKAAAEEIAWSRVYGGIHFWTAGKDGLKMGAEIGKYIQRNFFTEESH